MQSEPQRDNPKGLKAMLEKARASLFSPLRTHDAVSLQLAKERATSVLDDLDNVLSRSQAAQIQRETKQ